MPRPTIYLAGPMKGLTWEHAYGWRQWATGKLTKAGWKILCPVRPQISDVDPSTVIQNPAREELDSDKRPILKTASAFVTKDELFIRRSDMLLANFLDATEVSAGTMWELGLAWGLGKQIVSVFEAGNPHDTAFVRRRSHVFVDTLAEAVEYLEHLV